MDAIQTLEDLMRRHREEGRGVEYADLVPVLAALKAQRDELLAALTDVIGWVPGRAHWHTDAPIKSVERARALIAKHKEASHG